MKAKEIGIMDLKFNNNSGELIEGTNLYLGFSEERVIGLKCEKFFIKNTLSLPEGLKVNDTIEITFNYKAKIESIIKA